MGQRRGTIRRRRGGQRRCPYCHTDLPKGGVSCGGCRAQHHKVCLLESPRCAVCGQDLKAALEAALPERTGSVRRAAAVDLQSGAGLVVLALLALPLLLAALFGLSLSSSDAAPRRDPRAVELPRERPILGSPSDPRHQGGGR